MKCVLHIGTEKTATTLLQSWLYANQEALSAQGVYLSDNLERPNNRLFPSYFENGLNDWAKRHNISTLEEKQKYFEGFLDRLADEIVTASSEHDVFVITSEHLHSRARGVENIGAIADFLNRHFREVKIVCYFRDQFDMAVSHYSTALKMSSIDSVESHVERATMDNYYFNFLEIANRWSGAFGKSNCIFKLYNRADFLDGDIRKDFLQEVLPEIDTGKLSFKLSAANESLSYLQAAAYRSINKTVPFWDEQNGGVSVLNRRLKKEVSQITTLKRGKITSAARADLVERFEDSNRRFFNEYFDGSSSFNRINDELAEAATFSIEDVGGIVSDIFDQIIPLVSPAENLEDGDAKDVPENDVKTENTASLSGVDASTLFMELAKRARRIVSFIPRKVREDKDLLDSDS